LIKLNPNDGLQNAKNGTYKLIGDSLRQHPENIINKFNQDEVKVKLMNGSYAHIHVSIKMHTILYLFIASSTVDNWMNCLAEYRQLRTDRFDVPRKWQKVSNDVGKRNRRLSTFCLYSFG